MPISYELMMVWSDPHQLTEEELSDGMMRNLEQDFDETIFDKVDFDGENQVGLVDPNNDNNQEEALEVDVLSDDVIGKDHDGDQVAINTNNQQFSGGNTYKHVFVKMNASPIGQEVEIYKPYSKFSVTYDFDTPDDRQQYSDYFAPYEPNVPYQNIRSEEQVEITKTTVNEVLVPYFGNINLQCRFQDNNCNPKSSGSLNMEKRALKKSAKKPGIRKIRSQAIKKPSHNATGRVSVTRNRAKKSVIEKMTVAERDDKRKEDNRRNTRNYEGRKRNRYDNLHKRKDDLSCHLETIERDLKNGKNCFIIAQKIIDSVAQNNERLISNILAECEDKISSIRSNSISKKVNDPNLINLRVELDNKEKEFKKASNDIQQKEKNVNTFGSKKSRAKKEMHMCELDLEIGELEFKLSVVEELTMVMNECKLSISPYILHVINPQNIAYWRTRCDKIYEVRDFFTNS